MRSPDTRRSPGAHSGASQILTPASDRITPDRTPDLADSQLAAAVDEVFDPGRFAHLAQHWYVDWARGVDEIIVTLCNRRMVPRPLVELKGAPMCPFCEAIEWAIRWGRA